MDKFWESIRDSLVQYPVWKFLDWLSKHGGAIGTTVLAALIWVWGWIRARPRLKDFCTGAIAASLLILALNVILGPSSSDPREMPPGEIAKFKTAD